MSAPPPRKAYSYLRFSTPEQAAGDSFRRQHQMAVSYALAKGLELDDTLTFHDLGRSGFRGQNLETGRLKDFLEAIDSGEVEEGSYLLVESLDRISRQAARKAFRTLEDIAERGVTVVTLNDGREYSKESLDRDPTDLLLSILQFMRANEESATKARRLKEAWKAKRSRLSTEVLTSRVPAWLSLNSDTRQLELIPDRAAIVERIFRETLDGKGQASIAADLNREGVRPWGRAEYWQRSYIAKTLASEAAIGTFTPHTLDYVEGRRTRTPQEPLKGYYPSAVTDELWHEVQAFTQGKHSRSRGRHAANPVTNMLAALAVCPECDGTMTRVNKGSRSTPSYVCARAKSGAGCSYRSVKVATVEEAILTHLPARLRDKPAGERNPELDREYENLNAALGIITDDIGTLTAAILKGGEAVTLVKRMRELEGEYEETRDSLRKVEAMRADAAGLTVQSRIAKLLDALQPKEGQPSPGAVNLALQTVFERVTINYREGLLEFAWRHGGTVDLPYALPEGLESIAS